MRMLVLIAAAVVAIFSASIAQAADVTAADAQQSVRSMADNALAIAADKSLTDGARDERFRALLTTSFAITDISKRVLGHRWDALTDEQRAAFSRRFEQITVVTWSHRFRDAADARLDILGAVPDGNGWLVNTAVYSRDIEWRLDGQLKVVDVAVGGVSLIATSRADYQGALQGGIDGLLVAMDGQLQRLQAE